MPGGQMRPPTADSQRPYTSAGGRPVTSAGAFDRDAQYTYSQEWTLEEEESDVEDDLFAFGPPSTADQQGNPRQEFQQQQHQLYAQSFDPVYQPAQQQQVLSAPKDVGSSPPAPAYPSPTFDPNARYPADTMAASQAALVSFPLMSRHRRRKEKQWQVWVGDILPSLLPTYFKLLATTKSLQAEPVLSEPTPCSCEGRIRDLSIVIVRFTASTTRALSMLAMVPTLAVDLRVLSFVSKLFVHLPPNHTAWCQAVESFLSSQGYKLAGEDPLRRRFSNALNFYNHLENLAQQHIETLRSRVQSGGGDANLPGDIDNFADIPSTPQRKRSRTHDSPNSHTTTEGGEVSGENPFNDPPNRERPSDYLRSRCPACFGGKFPRPSLQGPDALVCLDACFTQKRRPSERDPPLMHPRSVFIPELLVNQMDEYITLQRSAHRRGAHGDESDDEDRREDGLPISNAVLAGCEKSFTAADES
ncbi:hypothetical protein ONZ45_g15948 [Pleurotus djamor]|nr:hypothetical protein ONZ45_g15948 [Pleurotus djamor]